MAAPTHDAMTVRVHWLQHVPFEGLGSIGPWLQARGHRVSATRLYAGERLPAVGSFDWLIAMGGPMNVDEHAVYPWLQTEKRLIAAALAANKRMLGICLGAQLMARALGAAVTPGQTEIGWFEVELKAGAADSPLLGDFPARFTAFHWHGDQFQIPAGVSRAAASAACRNQAFVFGRRAVALQFHLEASPQSVAALAEHCAGELALAPTVQTAAAMLAQPERFTAGNLLMDTLLQRLESA